MQRRSHSSCSARRWGASLLSGLRGAAASGAVLAAQAQRLSVNSRE